MKFELITKFENILPYNVVYKDFLFEAKDFLLSRSSIIGKFKEETRVHKPIYNILECDNIIHVFFDSKGILLDPFSLERISTPAYEDLRVFERHNYEGNYFYRRSVNSKSETCLFNLEKNESIWCVDRLIRPVSVSGEFFSALNSNLEKIDTDTGELIWSASVSKQGSCFLQFEKITRSGEVRRILGIYNSILWVELSNFVLLGYDVESGALKHELRGSDTYDEDMFIVVANAQKYNTFITKNCLFDEKNGKIILLMAYASKAHPIAHCYCEVDLNAETPSLVIEPVSNTSGYDSFKVQGGGSPVFPFDDDYIYTCDFQESKIALFNRKTKSIEWVHQLQTEKGSIITKMEVVGTRWMIWDYDNNLHIYERIQ